MGHTQYNELANGGQTIYATTRSTGQIEEGRPGFSLTAIDGDVISSKFKERGASPSVMITSPSDRALIRQPASATQVVRARSLARSKIWNAGPVDPVQCTIGESDPHRMKFAGAFWHFEWDLRQYDDGLYKITVEAVTARGGTWDTIISVVSQSGSYAQPQRKSVDFENAISAYPEKGIWGPNSVLTKTAPRAWPSWRGR